MSTSWQPFVDELLMCEVEGRHLTAAAIVGHDGTVWAQSAAFPQFRSVEIANIVKDFYEPGHLSPRGLFLGPMKYMVIRGEPLLRIIQGQPGAVIRRGKKVPDFVHRLWFLINCFLTFNLYGRYMPLWHGFYFWSRMLVRETIAILAGSGGITVMKTGLALIIGIYDQPMTPKQCNILVERLGKYLIEFGM